MSINFASNIPRTHTPLHKVVMEAIPLNPSMETKTTRILVAKTIHSNRGTIRRTHTQAATLLIINQEVVMPPLIAVLPTIPTHHFRQEPKAPMKV